MKVGVGLQEEEEKQVYLLGEEVPDEMAGGEVKVGAGLSLCSEEGWSIYNLPYRPHHHHQGRLSTRLFLRPSAPPTPVPSLRCFKPPRSTGLSTLPHRSPALALVPLRSLTGFNPPAEHTSPGFRPSVRGPTPPT